jgi:hypothetical protein
MNINALHTRLHSLAFDNAGFHGFHRVDGWYDPTSDVTVEMEFLRAYRGFGLDGGDDGAAAKFHGFCHLDLSRLVHRA